MLNNWATKHAVSDQALAELRQLMVPPDNPPVLHALPDKSEAAGQQEIRLEAPKHGVRLWRNNNGAVYDKSGRLIRYGLANDSRAMSARLKSSDLIGITPYVVVAGDIGKTLGIFTSIEVKRQGWVYKGTPPEKAQFAWINFILSLGGYAKFARGPEDVWG